LKRLGAALVAVVALLGGFAYVHFAQPAFWARLWHPLHYETIIQGHAEHYDLEPALLAAVVYQESRFRADAESPSGAIGLMQLLPSTAQGIADHTGGSRYRRSDLYDPEINIRYGAWYLRHLIDKYGSERLALAAYNAGQDNVDKWLEAGEGIVFPETRAYIDKVESMKRLYRRIYPQLRASASRSGSP
jgi:soluble lytic murein transglycosylase